MVFAPLVFTFTVFIKHVFGACDHFFGNIDGLVPSRGLQKNGHSELKVVANDYARETFDVITKLGTGSFGTVWLVKDPDTKSFYADKRIPIDMVTRSGKSKP